MASRFRRGTNQNITESIGCEPNCQGDSFAYTLQTIIDIIFFDMSTFHAPGSIGIGGGHFRSDDLVGDEVFAIYSVPPDEPDAVAAVPEPSTLLLLASGLAGIWFGRKRLFKREQ